MSKRIKVQVDVGITKDGKRVRKCFYGKTKREARAKRDAWLDERERQSHTSVPLSITLNEWAHTWLKSVHGLTQETTYKGKVSAVNSITQILGDKKVSEIKPIDIQTYVTGLQGMSKSTISKNRCVFKSILESAVTNGIITRNPWCGIRVPVGTYNGHRALTEYERRMITDSAYSRCGLWAVLMLYTGMRKEELFGLYVSDIDFTNEVIHITKASVLKENGRIKQPKTSAGVRDVPILPQFSRHLQTHIAHRHCDERLFVNADGKPYVATTIERMWKDYTQRLGIRFTAHDLRYTYATMLYDANVDLKTAQKLLGHEDVSVTMNIYTKLSAERETKSVRAFRDYMEVKWRSESNEAISQA